MKNNNTRIIVIILLVFAILTLATNIISFSRSVFVERLFMKGGTIIQLRVEAGYNMDDLKETVQNAINQIVQSMEISQETAESKVVQIKIAYLDAKDRADLNNALLQLENKGVQLTMIESISPFNKEGKQRIYILFGAMIIILLTLLTALVHILRRGNRR